MKPSLIEHILDQLNKHNKSVQVVSIGAFDGVSNDHFYPHLKHNRWYGLLVEPVPNSFQLLQNNVGDIENIQLENAAISGAKTESLTLYVPSLYPGAPSWLPQTATTSTAQAEKVTQNILKTTVSPPNLPLFHPIQVPAMTISALLEKHDIVRFDVLGIDTEGYDYEVLRQVDFEKYTPTIIIYEFNHLSYGNLLASIFLLQQKGYRLLREGKDIIAIQESFYDQLSLSHHTLRQKTWPLCLLYFPPIRHLKNLFDQIRLAGK